MFSEPGGILRNISVAVDYQFGFKVSETWFYKLLGRVILPLLILQAIIIMALTCVVVVPPGHQAIIEHFGERPRMTAKPGIHFTLPWPIDRTTLIAEGFDGYATVADSPGRSSDHRWSRSTARTRKLCAPLASPLSCTGLVAAA